jgi:myo-inositol-1(or 4)-monophosphatase
MKREKECAVRAARAAGEIIRSFYEQTYTVAEKGYDSPVTPADLQANRKIHEILQESFPDYGWLSEETVDSPERLSCPRVWVVDPMDGTKEFVQKIPEFSVSVALVEDGRPLIGVSYNPIRDQLFFAVRGQGVFQDGKQVYVSTTSSLTGATVLASRSEHKRGEWEQFKSLFRVIPTGSAAYKFALVAAGKADATFTLVPKNEWDICAGALLVEEGGGKVTDLDGRPITFNHPKTLLRGVVVSNGFLHQQIFDLIARTQQGRVEG